MKRLICVVALVALAASLSACNVGPTAATVGNDTISATSLTSLLSSMVNNEAVQCSVSIDWYKSWFPAGTSPATAAPTVDGAGDDTVTTDVAAQTLHKQIEATLLSQTIARHHGRVTASDTTFAEEYLQDVELSLTSDATDPSGQTMPTPPSCAGFGTTYDPSQVYKAWPKAYRDLQVSLTADEAALARVLIHPSQAELAAYYQQNKIVFGTSITVRLITVATDQQAQQIATAISKGASFAAEARAHSTASNAASGGVYFTGPPQELNTEAASVYQLIAPLAPGATSMPIQSGPSQWALVQLSDVTAPPLASVQDAIMYAIVVPQETAVNPPALAAVGRQERIGVDPRYGQWTSVTGTIVTPPSPPSRTLLNCLANVVASGDAAPGTGPSPAPGCAGAASP